MWEEKTDSPKGQQLQSPGGKKALGRLQTLFYRKYGIHREEGEEDSPGCCASKAGCYPESRENN